MKLKKVMATILCAILAFVLIGCGQTAKESATTETNQEFQNAIMFCGSTSLYPIISSLASSFTEEHATWDKVDSSFEDKNIQIFVAPGGSGVGVSALLDETADYGMLARTIKDEEKEEIGAGYTEYVVAKDALTVSVNANNPICDVMDDMSVELIRQIFAGEITTWDKVDPSLPSEPIQVFIRDLSGGAYEVFQKAVMGDSEVVASATQSASMTELATNIASNEWAIGYAGFGAFMKANEDGVVLKDMKVDGVACTEETILSGEYVIQRPVMFIGNGEPSATEKAFIDYVFSDVGFKVVEENGYIPAFKVS